MTIIPPKAGPCHLFPTHSLRRLYLSSLKSLLCLSAATAATLPLSIRESFALHPSRSKLESYTLLDSTTTMSVDSPNKLQEKHDVYSILLPEGDNLISKHEQDTACLALGGLMQLPNLFKSQMLPSFTQMNTQDCITLLVGDPACYPSDPPDVEKGSFVDTSTATIEAPGNAKSEGLATIRKVLQRQVSGHMGAKFTQNVIEYFLVVLSIFPRAERTHEASTNKCRKYKRSASFDSRKVGLFFSILSIIGTLILIYLTLRVRQAALVPA